MGHLRLGTLPQTKKWREVVALLAIDAPNPEVADAAARAADRDLSRAADDPVFRFVSNLLAVLPLQARGPGYQEFMRTLGISIEETTSVVGLLAGIDRAIDRHAFEAKRSSDIGEMSKPALLSALSAQFENALPSFFEPTQAEIRLVLTGFSSGAGFAALARDFFARLTFRSLDYYLSRELANHTGEGQRFATDADRSAFQRGFARRAPRNSLSAWPSSSHGLCPASAARPSSKTQRQIVRRWQRSSSAASPTV